MSSKEKKFIERPIIIAGKSYDIRNTDKDNSRRCYYFKSKSSDTTKFGTEPCDESGELVPAEQQLIEDLGIDEDFIVNHAYEMYYFFKELPNCQTTTALTLNHGCSTAHYILFSILMQRQNKTQEEFEKQKQPPVSTEWLTSLSKYLYGAKEKIAITPSVTPETPEKAAEKMILGKKDTRRQDVLEIFTLEI